jgi:Zn-dependent alcohol dehydrogenase
MFIKGGIVLNFKKIVRKIRSKIQGNLKVKDVITDEIELDDIVESGFEQLVNDKSQAKILVKL